MARPFHLAGAAVASLLLCSVCFAQRGAVGGARMGARSAPARSFSANRFEGTAFRSPQIQPVMRSFSYGYTPAGAPFYYPNLPPLNGNFRNPPRSGSRQGFGRGRGTFVPIFWGGVPYYYDCLDTYINCLDESGDQQGYAAAATQAPAPQVIVIQQPVPVAQAGPQDPNEPAAAPPSADPAPATTPDTSGFVLIRRNGQVVFASAYTVIGPNIRYVTPEGIIRTMPLADLDIDSTRSMNEARGVALFPN